MQRSESVNAKSERRAEVLRLHDNNIPKPQVPAVPAVKAVPPATTVPAVPTVDPLAALVKALDAFEFAEDRRKEALYFQYQWGIRYSKEKFQKLNECLKNKDVSVVLRQRAMKIFDTWGDAIKFDKKFRDKLSAKDLELIKEEIKGFAKFRATVGLKTADFFKTHQDCCGDGILYNINLFIPKEVTLIDSLTDNLFA